MADGSKETVGHNLSALTGLPNGRPQGEGSIGELLIQDTSR
jgi:hypothetical protein